MGAGERSWGPAVLDGWHADRSGGEVPSWGRGAVWVAGAGDESWAGVRDQMGGTFAGRMVGGGGGCGTRIGGSADIETAKPGRNSDTDSDATPTHTLTPQREDRRAPTQRALGPDTERRAPTQSVGFRHRARPRHKEGVLDPDKRAPTQSAAPGPDTQMGLDRQTESAQTAGTWKIKSWERTGLSTESTGFDTRSRAPTQGAPGPDTKSAGPRHKERRALTERAPACRSRCSPVLKLYYHEDEGKSSPAKNRCSSTKVVLPGKEIQPPETVVLLLKGVLPEKENPVLPETAVPVLYFYYQRRKIQPSAGDFRSSTNCMNLDAGDSRCHGSCFSVENKNG